MLDIESQDFEYVSAASISEATGLLQDGQGDAYPIAGGTDLLTLIGDGVTPAKRLVGIADIPGLNSISETDQGLEIGAAATIADIAAHDLISTSYTALSQAAAGLATPQIRNVGTLGGNLNQRPRCWYFRSPLIPCLKKGGDRCYALAGVTKYLCVTGGDRCYIVHPSDTGVALSVFGGMVRTSGPNGGRQLEMDEFFAGPGRDLLRENVLETGELVTGVWLPRRDPDHTRSVYLKAREREAGDFALVSAAVAITIDGIEGDSDPGAQNKPSIDKPWIKESKVALGGVAPVPYRSAAVEDYLTGREVAGVDAAQLGDLVLTAATPLPQNEYKIAIARNLVVRAVAQLLEAV